MKILKPFITILLATSLSIAASATLQNDVHTKNGDYVMLIRPFNPNNWSRGKLTDKIETSAVVPKEIWPKVIQLFKEVDEVVDAAAKRKTAYSAYLDLMEREESEMSLAPVRFQMVMYDKRYLFDKYGRFYIDGRFVLPRELAIIQELEDFYKRVHDKSEISHVYPEASIVDKAKERATQKLYIFRGFEDDHYQQYDNLIVKLVDDFNHNRGHWAGATPAQARQIHTLPPNLVKAHMIEETGGMRGRSRDAWNFDPLQINVPGDWNKYKSFLGIKEPKKRNEGTATQNIIAAIKYLSRKGFGSSGQPAGNRPTGTFDGWVMALKRYNGRNDETLDGRHYKEAYAERIVQRSREPDNFVPISIPTKKK